MRASSLSHKPFPSLPLRLQRWHAVARANPAMLTRDRVMPLVSMVLGALMLVLLVVWFKQVAVPFDCRPTRLPLRFDSQAEAAMTINRGAPCALIVDTGSASVAALSVEAAPANGTVVPRGRTGVVYRPAAEFKGDDDFVVAFTGRANNKPGTMQVHVRVAVK